MGRRELSEASNSHWARRRWCGFQVHLGIRTTAAGFAIIAVTAGYVVVVGFGAETAQASTCSHSRLPLPDPGCTPGAYNSGVTQSNIHSTFCVSGWTATVRPPTSCTNPLKARGIIDYGYSETNMADYEQDHLVPTWSPWNSAADTITLSATRSAIKNNWTTALRVTGIG